MKNLKHANRKLTKAWESDKDPKMYKYFYYYNNHQTRWFKHMGGKKL